MSRVGFICNLPLREKRSHILCVTVVCFVVKGNCDPLQTFHYILMEEINNTWQFRIFVVFVWHCYMVHSPNCVEVTTRESSDQKQLWCIALGTFEYVVCLYYATKQIIVLYWVTSSNDYCAENRVPLTRYLYFIYLFIHFFYIYFTTQLKWQDMINLSPQSSRCELRYYYYTAIWGYVAQRPIFSLKGSLMNLKIPDLDSTAFREISALNFYDMKETHQYQSELGLNLRS